MDARALLEAIGIIKPGQEPKNPIKRELIEGAVLFEDEIFLSVEKAGEVTDYFILDGQIYLAESFDQVMANPELKKALAALTMEGLQE